MTVTLAPPPFLQFMNPNNSGSPAAGFQLFTYQAGTSTKQNTWVDSTQTSLNTNPIVLDANGVANVWGDPTLLYKFVLSPPSDTDPPNSPLRTVDNVSFPLTTSTASGIVGSTLYPRSSAEQSASITPTNFLFPWGDLRRYGADPSGVLDSGAAFVTAMQTGHRVLGGGADCVYRYSANIIIPALANIRFDGQQCTMKPSGNALIANTNASAVATTTVATGATQGSISITVSSGAGLAVGQIIQFSDAAAKLPTFFATAKSVSGVTVGIDSPFPFDYSSSTVNVTAYTQASWVQTVEWRNVKYDLSALTSTNATLGMCLRIVNAMDVSIRDVLVTNAISVPGSSTMTLMEVFLSGLVDITGCHFRGNVSAVVPGNGSTVAIEVDDCNHATVSGNVISGEHFGINLTRCPQAVAAHNVLKGKSTYEIVNVNPVYSTRGIKMTTCGTAQVVGNSIDDYTTPVKVDVACRTIIQGNSTRNTAFISGTNNTDAAFELTGLGPTNMFGHTITGNVIENSGGLGIYVDNSGGATFKGWTIITSNVIRGTQDRAIFVNNAEAIISNNIIANWDLAAAGLPAVVFGDGAYVAGNAFWHETDATKVCLSSTFVTSYRYVLRDNRSPTGNPLFTLGNANIGVDTQGTGSIAAASTTTTITHNSLRTPNPFEIILTPTAAVTTDYGYWWISGITTTQFTVNVAVAPGSGGFNFNWRVNLLQPWTA